MLPRKYSVKEIAGILSAEVSGDSEKLNLIIDRIATDSRYKGIGINSCFFAIRSESNDGHNFILDAYNRGVRCFVAELEMNLSEFPQAVFLRVKDSVQALQKLGSFRRKEIKYPVIGITGSNGKTVVKEWLFQILSTRKIVYRSPKSYNSQIGVPLSLLMMPDKADVALIEAGISKRGEMINLESIIKPEIGMLTNINKAHIENFDDKEELTSEKLNLFENVKTLIYRKDYSEIGREISKRPAFRKVQLLDWSTDPKVSPGMLVNRKIENDRCEILLKTGSNQFSVTLPFTDNASFENAVHCIIAARHLGVEDNVIMEVLSTIPSVGMRLQLLNGINNCTLINDSYNSDLTSLEIALGFLNMQKKQERSTLIISDIYQSGMSLKELYGKVDEMSRLNQIDRIIGIGRDISSVCDSFRTPIVAFESTDEFLDSPGDVSFLNEIILIKGSRKFGFERISNSLMNKRHETTLEVNLSAVVDNLNFFKSRLEKNVGIMVMVKAFSYGTGTYEIANMLEHHGVDYLAVAYIDEGITLRKNGIKSPLMVMNASIGEIGEMINFNLEPEIFNIKDLIIASKYLEGTGRELGIHLKLETGMHRLGVGPEEIPEIIEILKNNKRLKLKTVFSHLVAGGESTFDDFTNDQIRKFEFSCKQLIDNGISGFKRHILNSDGILRFPENQYDMVRLGIGLYGLSSVDEFKNDLRSVAKLKSGISQIKHLKKGESVGYGRSFIAERNMLTATIPIGYADGLVRQLGKGEWYFRIKDKKAPILGNICMDMTMIDITDIENVRENDEVVIFDGNEDIYKMAEKRSTIPYEILTSVSERVKRIYFFGD